jgi:glycosyltransferase involved in cell wall biosynthesis
VTVVYGEAFSRISLIVITLNEEDNIERCLGSADGVGEIIIVDSHSTDRTVEHAERLGAVVYRRPFISAADQKNWALERAKLDWVLILDADESLSPEIAKEIATELAHPRADGYLLRRRNFFFGRRIRYCGWQGDRVLRLFRRGHGRYPEVAVHERLALDGTVAALRCYLDHRPYRDMADYIDRMKSYSRRGAEELHRRGKRWFPALVTHPVGRFFRMYILQGGFLDGGAGLVLCVLAAMSVCFKYAILREMTVSHGSEPER